MPETTLPPAIAALARQIGFEYPASIPRDVPEGRIVVHNRVRPATRQGVRGFRFWTEPASTASRVECDCEWAPHLPEHYRVAQASSPGSPDEAGHGPDCPAREFGDDRGEA